MADRELACGAPYWTTIKGIRVLLSHLTTIKLFVEDKAPCRRHSDRRRTAREMSTKDRRGACGEARGGNRAMSADSSYGLLESSVARVRAD